MQPMTRSTRWYRKQLPHFNTADNPQHIIFRVEGALPVSKTMQMVEQCKHMNEHDKMLELRSLIDEYLDDGMDDPALADPRVADVVQNSLLHFDGERYDLFAWVVMPNHVHALVLPYENFNISSIVHSWKRHSARQANLLLKREGAFWHRDYFDRFTRSPEDFINVATYIENNPVKSKLCERPKDWIYSSAHYARKFSTF